MSSSVTGQRSRWRRQDRAQNYQPKDTDTNSQGGPYADGDYEPFSSIPTQASSIYDDVPKQTYAAAPPSFHHMGRNHSEDMGDTDFHTPPGRDLDDYYSQNQRQHDDVLPHSSRLVGDYHPQTLRDASDYHTQEQHLTEEYHGYQSQAGKQQELYDDIGFAPTPSMNQSVVDGLVRELRTLAALEVSVYLARGSKHHSQHMLSLHTPARRLARTIVTFGAEEGVLFGMRAVRAMEAAADACTDDVRGMLFWWSNCVQLRWMLWAMCGGADGDEAEGLLGDFASIKQVLLPPLWKLETVVFDRMVHLLWHKVAVPASCLEGRGIRPPSPPAVPKRNANPMKSTSEMSTQHDAAVERWLIGLGAALDRLEPPGSPISLSKGHLLLVKQRLFHTLLHKLDAVLFEVLISDDHAHLSKDISSEVVLRPLAAHEMPDRVLPFPRGYLTFSTGINLKMAVSRWTNWARDKGLDEGPGADGELFPKLRASADLLMLPKDFLMDPTVRQEVVPNMRVNDICSILQRFRPDEFSPDSVPKGLVERLTQESQTKPNNPRAKPHDAPSYQPATEEQLLTEGLIEPVSLEMDDESDDELEAITEMYDPDRSGEGSYRFMLLRDLWASAR